MIFIKKYILLLFFCVYYFSFSIENEIYKDRMRNFVKEIRNNTSKDRIIISQNGNELYFKNNGIDEEFFKITDGTTQESLYYGDVLKFNIATSEEMKNKLW